MNRTSALLFVCSLTTSGAFAQSLNVDIDRSSGTGAGTPSIACTGACGQIGYWNSMNSSAAGAVAMYALNGTSTAVTCTKQTGGGSTSSVAGASADFGALMFDYMMTTGQGSKVGVTLNGLSAGLYRVYVYSAMPGSAGSYLDQFSTTNYYDSLVVVKVGGSQIFSNFCGGPVTPNVYSPGVDYVVGNILVGAGAPAVDIESHTGYTNYEKAALNGFQLVKYTGNILYVNSAATGANTGQTWYNAFTNLQDALQLARDSAGQITQIWIAQGTYFPTGVQSGTNRTVSFDLVSGVKVYGGFVGNEASLDQRDPASHIVTLSGNIGVGGTLNDNSYHVVTGTNLDSTTLLDSVLIYGGNSNKADNTDNGGAMVLTNSSPTFRNVTFSGNRTKGGSGAVNINGGGPTFEQCEFSYNQSLWGSAGIEFAGPTGFFAPVLKVNRCKFLANHTDSGEGSGILVKAGSAWIANSLFVGNYAGEGGAVAAGMPNGPVSHPSAALYDCTVVSNAGAVQSGGLYAFFGGSVSARNSIIFFNTSQNAWRGKEFEQMYAQPDSSTMTATYCDIQEDARAVFPGAGNLAIDPHFVDVAGSNGIMGDADDDLRLADDSPLIDRGSNSLLPIDFTDTDQNGNSVETTPLDLDGLARQVDDPGHADLGVGPAPIVDIGCFEFQAPPCPADFNQDGGIDGTDVQAFFAAWQAGDAAADVNRDGGVDGSDVGFFFAAWQNGGC